MRNQRIEQLKNPGLIPVIRLNSGDALENLLESLLAGGITCAELTMTMPDAPGLLRKMKEKFSGRMLLGMGTILSTANAREALDAGAEFLVTPVFVDGVIELAHAQDVPVSMGALSPTEAFHCHTSGADFVKIFPLNVNGNKYIKTLLEPMPFLQIIPSGGVGKADLPEIFQYGAQACCIGGELVRKDLIAKQDWKGLTENAKSFTELRKTLI